MSAAPVADPPDRAAGFFGKLPSHGDFVSRRLPRSFLDPWDRWLQAALACSREQLGEAWLDAFLTSPMWRFVLSGDLCGPRAWAGVLMPSVDRVGRYFPLTLAMPVTDVGAALHLTDADQDWFAAAEGAALGALDDDFSMERFDAAVERLAQVPGDSRPSLATVAVRRRPPRAWHLSLGQETPLREALPALVQQLLQGLSPTHSLWWSSGSQRIAPSLVVHPGLPPIDAYSALLDGDWGRWENPQGLAATAPRDAAPSADTEVK